MKNIPVLILAGTTAAILLCGSGKAVADPLREAAERGDDPAAQVKLGREFFTGKNRPGNLARAAWWFRRAAVAGDPEGAFHYGACLEFGWGVEKSLHGAIREYRKAASLPQARFRTAHLLRNGLPEESDGSGGILAAVPPAPELAMAELRKLAAEKFPPAHLELAKHLYSDPAKRKECAAEIRQLAAEAAATDAPPVPEAKLFYAGLLRSGYGGPVDEAEAGKQLADAVKAGYAPALTQLAILCDTGLPGFDNDPKKVLELLRTAAGRGEPQAMCILGDKYLSGEGLPHDPVKAAEYFARAAAAGYAGAFYRLGDCFMYGFGKTADAAAAVAEYEKGARTGEPEAQCRLGRAYLNGTGVAADPTAAVFWFKCAGSSGNAAAVRELALALLAGRGIKKDPVEGMRLLRAAAESGDSIAAGMLNRYQ